MKAWLSEYRWWFVGIAAAAILVTMLVVNTGGHANCVDNSGMAVQCPEDKPQPY